jgi:hypothetical protein
VFIAFVFGKKKKKTNGKDEIKENLFVKFIYAIRKVFNEK